MVRQVVSSIRSYKYIKDSIGIYFINLDNSFNNLSFDFSKLSQPLTTLDALLNDISDSSFFGHLYYTHDHMLTLLID